MTEAEAKRSNGGLWKHSNSLASKNEGIKKQSERTYQKDTC